MKIKEYLTFDDVLIQPRYSSIKSRLDTDIRTKLSTHISLNIPIISSNMSSVTESKMSIAMALEGGVGVLHRFKDPKYIAKEIKIVKDFTFDKNEFPIANTDSSGKLIVGASVGIREDFLKSIEIFTKENVDFIVIDVAHAHSLYVINAIKEIKKEFGSSFDLIVGNIATKEAAKDLASLGIDAIKVGIGPGSVCTTRMVAGVGVPQLSAIDEVYKALSTTNIPIIADGGIRYPADISKAIAAGANTVMLGNLLAKTTESAGDIVEVNGTLYKRYAGGSSETEMRKRFKIDKREWSSKIAPEGVEGLVKIEGSVADILNPLTGGLRSALSYTNSKNISQFHKNVRFIRITSASLKENGVHDVIVK